MNPQNEYPGNRPVDSGSNFPASPRPAGPGTAPGYSPYPGQAPYGHYPAYAYPPQKQYSTKAIISMVMAGVSVLICPLASIAGIVLGVLGMRESKEPGGAKRGWGLAVGGLITNAAILVLTLAVAGVMVWALSMAENYKPSHANRYEIVDARGDLMLIRDRLKLYAIENNNSLAPGGPVVREGWSVSYDENSPRVTDRLRVLDLVTEMEMDRLVSEYLLEVSGTTGATVRNTVTGTTIVIENVLDENAYRIEERGTR